MHIWRKYVVIGLIICLLHLTVADIAVGRGVISSENSAKIKQRVEMLGVGASLEVEVKGSETVRGTIQSIADQEFVVAPKSSVGERHIAYDQVRGLILPQRTYKASGQPNAAEARRVVAGRGVGKKIRVTWADGRQLKGAIQSMDMEHFTVQAKEPAAATEVAYSDVRQIGSGGMSTGMQYAILGGIVAGVVIVVAVVLSQTSG